MVSITLYTGKTISIINYCLKKKPGLRTNGLSPVYPPPHPPPFFLGYEKKRREEHMPDQYNSTIASYLTDKCQHTALYKLSKDVHIKTSKITII